MSTDVVDVPEIAPDPPVEAQPAPAPTPASLPDRSRGTGKRKTSVARIILVLGGDGSMTINGRAMEDYFPRRVLAARARAPFLATGTEGRYSVIARVHGGGISSQAGAVRHGIARALVESDETLRAELKKQGFLTRDARMIERKKAGLRGARKRPQFSKR